MMKKISFTEVGRTLTEMLAVLSVIGILSVVGMELYAKAMNTARANHVVDRVMVKRVELSNDSYADYGDSTELGLERREKHRKRGRKFDIGGTSENTLAYGYQFNGASEAKKIVVDGVVTKSMCDILRKRLAEGDYQGLNDIEVGGVSLKNNACPSEISQMAFVFEEGVSKPITVKTVTKKECDPPKKKCKGKCYEPCTVIDGGTQTGRRDEDDECQCETCPDVKVWKTAENQCVCPDETPIECKGGCYAPCDTSETRDTETCKCEPVSVAQECPVNKPSVYGAECKYIEAQNCCNAEKSLTCSAEGKCVCISPKKECDGVCYDPCTVTNGGKQTGRRDEDNDCKCETCPDEKVWNTVKSQCVCPDDKPVECKGECYKSCATSETRDTETCKCKPVSVTQECPANKPSTCGAECKYIKGQNCCDAEKGLTCSAAGKCVCSDDKPDECKGTCYESCDTSETRDTETCECKPVSVAQECPVNKPSAYGAECKYIEGQNCCDAEKGLTCSSDKKCVCSGNKTICTKSDKTTVCVGGCGTGSHRDEGETCECVEDSSASCLPGETECNGQCYGPCDKEGQTGERDPENCQCKCYDWATAEMCCEPGYVLRDHRCVEIRCQSIGWFACYVDGTLCGRHCVVQTTNNNGDSDVRLLKVTKAQGASGTECRGYCDGSFCPGGDGAWGRTPIENSGLGCKSTFGEKLYCGTGADPMNSNLKTWFCKREDREDSPVCCQAKIFGKCSFGICNAAECEKVKNSDGTSSKYVSISPDLGGCEVVRNGQTAYCTLNNNQWSCFRSKMEGGIFEVCGSGILNRLNDPNSREFSECFTGQAKCPKPVRQLYVGGPVWNAEWSVKDQMCVGTITDEIVGTYKDNNGNAFVYGCDHGGKCYVKKGDRWEQCGYKCQSGKNIDSVNPVICQFGNCYSSVCTAGYGQHSAPYGKLSKFDDRHYGCISEREDGTYAYVSNKGCYYKKKGEENFNICGYGCSGLMPDCTSCATAELPQCAKAGECLKNGMEVKDCYCETSGGVISEGHCCPLGHTYLKGKCVLATVAKGKCLYKGEAIPETDDYGVRGDHRLSYSASCECRDETKCMNRSGETPVCGACSK